MKLSTINLFLRKIGLVLVIEYDCQDKQPTKFWIEGSRNYDLRTNVLGNLSGKNYK